jgi:molybdenum cofactor cytidylyltransferase
MIFGRVKLAQALGGILAHSLQTEDRVLRKGAVVDATTFVLLQTAGYTEVTIARLEPGDVAEGEAASFIGELLLGSGLRRSQDVHGRVNLFAEVSGLLRLDTAKIERLNRIDETVTLATLADRSVVAPDDIVATLKIIPFAVSGQTLADVETLIAAGPASISVRPFQNRVVGLILSRLPQTKKAAISHTVAATRQRILARGGSLLPPIETPHDTTAIRIAMQTLLAAGAEIILISGASAVTDRLDVAPQAIVQARGEITHFGMPVDPGNLICFGDIAGKPAIVLPGCARSPALNGIDWVLDRLFAGERVGPEEVAGMGVGGLLKEIAGRPLARDTREPSGFGTPPSTQPRIAAIVLAAGRSLRMQGMNKLLAPMPDGRPMVAQTVARIAVSPTRPILVVTGHHDGEIRKALANEPVRFVHAEDYVQGMSASLRAGIGALSGHIGAALICLGDMPFVDPGILDQLIAAFSPAEGREIVIPSFDGQRGNPVLWGQRFFPDLLKLEGDVGAKQILHLYPEAIVEVPVESDCVLLDVDTPETLAALAT